MYFSEHNNFTGGSPLATNGCQIDNQLGNDVNHEPLTLDTLRKRFAQANETKAADKQKNMFFLQSLAGGGPAQQIEYAALLHYLPVDHDSNRRKCAALFNVPGMTDWCPMSLRECSQLSNYYNQILLDEVITNNWHYPNAIYMDVIGPDGVILTNYTDGTPRGFAYADSVVLYNVRRTW